MSIIHILKKIGPKKLPAPTNQISKSNIQIAYISE